MPFDNLFTLLIHTEVRMLLQSLKLIESANYFKLVGDLILWHQTETIIEVQQYIHSLQYLHYKVRIIQSQALDHSLYKGPFLKIRDPDIINLWLRGLDQICEYNHWFLS